MLEILVSAKLDIGHIVKETNWILVTKKTEVLIPKRKCRKLMQALKAKSKTNSTIFPFDGTLLFTPISMAFGITRY